MSIARNIEQALYNCRRDHYIKYNNYPNQLIVFSQEGYESFIRDPDVINSMAFQTNTLERKAFGWPYVVDRYNPMKNDFEIYVR